MKDTGYQFKMHIESCYDKIGNNISDNEADLLYRL